MKIASGKIIKIKDFENIAELRVVDSTTQQTLSWFINAALEAEVDLGCKEDVTTFCRYLIICLTKTEDLLKYLLENNLDLLQVHNKLNMDK